MKLLVTGGAGFIGSNFIRYWLKNHQSDGIINLDKLTYAGHLSTTKDFSEDKSYKFIKGDICDPKVVDEVMRGADTVVHFAAESIPENVYVPIYSTVGTRVMTFGELWKQQGENNGIIKQGKAEVIFLRSKQIKALSYLNGGQWMPIKAITRHKYNGKIIKLTQKWGIVEATPNHSIYSSSLELSNPVNNPEVLVVRGVNEIRKKYKKVSNNLLVVIAAYVTEGNATFNVANGGHIVEIDQKSKKWLEKIGGSIKREFGCNFNISQARKGKFVLYHLQVSNKRFFEYMISNCGKYCDGKFFPNWIFDLKSGDRKYFWERLLEGDGTKDGRYTTTSFKLANQISLLLTLQNIKFTVFERNHPKYKRSYEFKTNLTGVHYGLNIRKKNEIDFSGWVYDIEVERAHNFVCGIGNVVCHNTHVDRSIVGPQIFLQTNVIGTQILLDAAVKYNIKRFHFVSTDEVFGALLLDSKEKFNEKTLYNPRSPYSASKAAADHLVRAYNITYGLPISITNCADNYGPYQDPEKFLARSITNLLEGKEIPIYGDGKYVRDWLYVKDHCRAIDVVINKGVPGETYMVGGLTEDINNLEIAKKLLKIFGKDENFTKFVKDRQGHDRRYAIDWSKIHDDLGWKPEHNFDEWLVKTVEWYQTNEWWWKPLKEEAEKLYAKTGQQ